MQFVSLPAQQSAAVTDAILAAVSLCAALYLLRFSRVNAWKARLWSVVMMGGAVAATMGAVTHGVVLSEGMHAFLWSWIHLVLWIVAALFAAAALYDWMRPAAVKKALPFMVAAALVSFGANRVFGSRLEVVMAVEGAVLVLALAVYGRLAVTARLKGAAPMALGIGLTILGAIMHAAGLGTFHFGWQFDRNGTFHLIQLAALVPMLLGLRAALRAHPPMEAIRG